MDVLFDNKHLTHHFQDLVRLFILFTGHLERTGKRWKYPWPPLRWFCIQAFDMAVWSRCDLPTSPLGCFCGSISSPLRDTTCLTLQAKCVYQQLSSAHSEPTKGPRRSLVGLDHKAVFHHEIDLFHSFKALNGV